MKRICCLWFPNWPIQRLVLEHPDLRRHSAILIAIEQPGRGEFVSHCNNLSRKRGVRAGMPISEARSLLHRRDAVHIEPFSPQQDQHTLEQFALQCERYSPCVGLEGHEFPECLLLDVTGLSHLFSGEWALTERIYHEFSTKGFTVHVAVASTPGAAWGASHFLTSPDKPTVMPCDTIDPFLSMPIEGLRLEEPAIDKFHRLGIHTLGQILELNRASLPSRFGQEVLNRLNRFLGDQQELIVPCRPLPAFCFRQELEYGLDRMDAITQLCFLLLNQLTQQLFSYAQGTRRLECRFFTECKTCYDFTLHLHEPCADPHHLEELLNLKLERFRLDASLIAVELETLETLPLGWRQEELFSGRSGTKDRQLSILLNRLSSRLGHEQVARPVRRPDPIPERTITFSPVVESHALPVMDCDNRFLPLDRPLCLNARPIPIEVIAIVPDGPPSALFFKGNRQEIVKWWGPERIESGWWRGPLVRRDYYRIATAEGKCFWIFRRIQDHAWFLHGEMA